MAHELRVRDCMTQLPDALEEREALGAAREAMSELEVRSIAESASVDSAVDEMLRHKLSCVVVLDRHGQAVGLFTVHDALRFLRDTRKAAPQGKAA